MFNINIYLLRVLVKEMYYGNIIIIFFYRWEKANSLTGNITNWYRMWMTKKLQQEKIAEHHQHPSAEHQWCWWTLLKHNIFSQPVQPVTIWQVIQSTATFLGFLSQEKETSAGCWTNLRHHQSSWANYQITLDSF